MRNYELPLAAAKASFSDCIRRAERGETLVLTRHGRPVARLAPLADPSQESVAEPEVEYREESTRGASEGRREALTRLLEEEVWPRVPKHLVGRGISKAEREEILGLDKASP